MTNLKMVSLAKELEVNVSEIEQGYMENMFEVNGMDYLVLNESEKMESVTEYIQETVWAFNSSFLEEMTEIDADVFKVLSEKCEDGNKAILSLIEKTCGLEEFVSEAVQVDGVGHFLSGYDGEELELENDLYAYRTN